MKSFNYFKTLIDADVVSGIELNTDGQELELMIGKDKAVERAERTIVLAVKEYWFKSRSADELLDILKTGDVVTLLDKDTRASLFQALDIPYRFDIKSQNVIVEKSKESYFPNPLFYKDSVLKEYAVEEGDSQIVYTKL